MIRIPYRPHALKQPAPPTLSAGTTHRFRPQLAVRLFGPGGRWRDFRSALVDTGADDTIFPADAATLIGAALLPGTGHAVQWRGATYSLRFAQVELQIGAGVVTFRWPAVVAFCAAPVPYPLLGNSGFLEFFDATFSGADHILELAPTASFPGTEVTRP